MSKRRTFWKDQRGVVSIEWVAIAAVAFVAAVAIAGALLGGADDLGDAVAGQMSATADEVDGTNSP